MESLKNIESLLYFSPEILLVIFAVAVIILDLVVKDRESVAVAYLSLVGCLCTFAAVLFTHFSFGDEGPVSLFLGMIHLDAFSSFFKVLLLLATAATILFSLRSEELDARLERRILCTFVSDYARNVPHGIVNEPPDDIHLTGDGKPYLLYSRWVPDTQPPFK